MIDLGSGSDLEAGCLGVGSISEFGRSDEGVNALSDRAGARFVSMLAARVDRGVKAGELKPSLDPIAVGRMLLTFKSGLKVAVRGGDEEARQSARLVLAGLAAN